MGEAVLRDYMIVASIYGGLGNQMFQYAFSKALAQNYQAFEIV